MFRQDQGLSASQDARFDLKVLSSWVPLSQQGGKLSEITTEISPGAESPQGGGLGVQAPTGLQLIWHIWCSRSRIALIALCGFVLGVIIALATPVRFEATTRIMPPESRGGALGLLASVTGGGSGGGPGGIPS